MNVEIGTEAAQFPGKEYINGIFLAVWAPTTAWTRTRPCLPVTVLPTTAETTATAWAPSDSMDMDKGKSIDASNSMDISSSRVHRQ
jgi:hypothetical protein